MGNEGVVSNVAVADAGPLIHLAQVDALNLLSVFDRVAVPRAVHVELADEALRSRLEVIGFDLVDVPVEETLDSLDSGETAAIMHAMDLDDSIFLTDDLDAREAATQRNIEVHGSVGVIAVAYSRGLLNRTEAAALMRSLQRDANLFVTGAVIERGLELLGQIEE